mmetsp:Transcript_29208/g.64589  ORF Transcript_29208/g.64589 Transcript_29208/m.64589 type:complete len:156 (-) Transcript_29208:533-1000(-)
MQQAHDGPTPLSAAPQQAADAAATGDGCDGEECGGCASGRGCIPVLQPKGEAGLWGRLAQWWRLAEQLHGREALVCLCLPTDAEKKLKSLRHELESTFPAGRVMVYGHNDLQQGNIMTCRSWSDAGATNSCSPSLLQPSLAAAAAVASTAQAGTL